MCENQLIFFIRKPIQIVKARQKMVSIDSIFLHVHLFLNVIPTCLQGNHVSKLKMADEYFDIVL